MAGRALKMPAQVFRNSLLSPPRHHFNGDFASRTTYSGRSGYWEPSDLPCRGVSFHTAATPETYHRPTVKTITIIALALVLSGCVADLVRVRLMGDGIVALGERASDAYLAGLDKAREKLKDTSDELKTESRRLDSLYCKAPYTALRRWAITAENQQFLAKTCGLIISADHSIRVIE